MIFYFLLNMTLKRCVDENHVTKYITFINDFGSSFANFDSVITFNFNFLILCQRLCDIIESQ